MIKLIEYSLRSPREVFISHQNEVVFIRGIFNRHTIIRGKELIVMSNMYPAIYFENNGCIKIILRGTYQYRDIDSVSISGISTEVLTDNLLGRSVISIVINVVEQIRSVGPTNRPSIAVHLKTRSTIYGDV